MSDQPKGCRVPSARAIRAQREFLVQVGTDGDDVLVFRLRQLDLPTLLFEGVLNLPLVQASDRFIELKRVHETGGDLAALGEMTDQDRELLLQMLRRYACAAVIEPRIAMTDTGDPDVLPVAMLGVETLFTIYNATPDGAPRLTEADADRFRAGAAIPAAPAPRAGEDLRPTAVGVADGHADGYASLG